MNFPLAVTFFFLIFLPPPPSHLASMHTYHPPCISAPGYVPVIFSCSHHSMPHRVNHSLKFCGHRKSPLSHQPPRSFMYFLPLFVTITTLTHFFVSVYHLISYPLSFACSFPFPPFRKLSPTPPAYSPQFFPITFP